MVSRGGSNSASYSTTNLIRDLKKHKAEPKEQSGATELKASLKQQTLIASLRKDKLGVLAVSCYTDSTVILVYFALVVYCN